MGLFLEVKISDGLGNQMFQYAAARSLCIKNKITYLLLNIESFNTNSVGRTFKLNHFKIKGNIIENSFFKKLLRQNSKYNNFISKLSVYKYISEETLTLRNLSSEAAFFTSIKGYWQSEYYFKDIRPQLLEEFVPLEIPVFPDWIKYKNTVAVHIRRGDYKTENSLGILDVRYYFAAIHMINNSINNPLFVFFSDDINWCKTTFKANNIIFCEEKEWQADYHQLFLMSKCAHQIIANSSFSWWAAWLNQNPDKIVIRPQSPFANSALMYESYYPETWTTASNYIN